MKKVMCFAVSMFMLVNLSFAATLSFRPIKNFKVDKIEKIMVDMKDEIKVDDAIVLKPIKIRIGEQEPIPVPAPIKPVLEIM